MLDEMHAPAIAAALRERGHDVVAVAERLDLRAMTDEELFAWAGHESRRLVTENVEDCYKALGVLHQTWQMIPGRFKDYISTPKTNGYRSLHTALIYEKKGNVARAISTLSSAESESPSRWVPSRRVVS